MDIELPDIWTLTGVALARIASAPDFNILFHVVNVAADFGALGAKSGDNVRFGHC